MMPEKLTNTTPMKSFIPFNMNPSARKITPAQKKARRNQRTSLNGRLIPFQFRMPHAATLAVISGRLKIGARNA